MRAAQIGVNRSMIGLSQPVALYCRAVPRVLYSSSRFPNQLTPASTNGEQCSQEQRDNRRLDNRERNFRAGNLIFTGKSRQNGGEIVIPVKLPSRKRKIKTWRGLKGDYANEFKAIMVSRDFDAAMRLYEDIKASEELPKANVLSGLMTVCHLKEHLDSAITLFKEFSVIGYPPNESAYMSLIRCYADDGQIDVALSLIEEMKKHAMEMRLRAYHPIMEAAAKLGDFKSATMAMKGMTSENVVPRAEHFVLLIEAAAKSGTIGGSASAEEIDKLLHDEIFNLTELNREGLIRIVAAFRGISVSDVESEGVLTKFGRSISLSHVPSGEHPSSHKSSEINSDPPVEWKANENESRTDNDKLSFDAADQSVPVCEDPPSSSQQKKEKRNVRLVKISSDTCSCPNCSGKLAPLLLDSEWRERVRRGLLNIVTASTTSRATGIHAFGLWLSKQTEEYKYVIDGANVAYHHQNFTNGRFSYRQIEILVNKIKEKNDGKILVLLHQIYTNKTISNSSNYGRNKSKNIVISEDDKRILKWLGDENMLYTVPYGGNDDWYWIYATVAEGRKSTAYVVSNDMIRDHRLAFLEPRPFLRWRSTQVMTFSFSRAVIDGKEDPEAFIYEADKFSAEVQKTSNQKWHLPCIDGKTWVCLADSVYPSPSSSLLSSSSSPSLSSSSPPLSSSSASFHDLDADLGAVSSPLPDSTIRKSSSSTPITLSAQAEDTDYPTQVADEDITPFNPVYRMDPLPTGNSHRKESGPKSSNFT